MQFKIYVSVCLCLLVQQSATLQLKAHQQIEEKVDEGALAGASGSISIQITNWLSTNKAAISNITGQVARLPQSSDFQLSNVNSSILSANQTLSSALASLNQENISFSDVAAAISSAMATLNTSYQNVQQASSIVASQNGTINNLNSYLSPASGNAQSLIDNYDKETNTIASLNQQFREMQSWIGTGQLTSSSRCTWSPQDCKDLTYRYLQNIQSFKDQITQVLIQYQ